MSPIKNDLNDIEPDNDYENDYSAKKGINALE
jgi:hypothetical protein